MKTVLTLIAGVAIGAIGAQVYPAASGAEPQPAATEALPDLPEPYYTVLFENDAVRVVDHQLAPGDSEPEHTHPPMVAYFVEGATLAITEADGSTSDMTIPTGAFLELEDWWTHSLDNPGPTPLHSVLVEFKNRPRVN